uniref:C2H2-type domain-containing protein n=1 Tax=viral metagenome TaxID=1070528 RepID=A0A6C0HDH7_9ZZZZ
MFECDFCNKKYSSISSLNFHKKTTKKCIEIQKKLNIETSSAKFNCKFCNKEFLLKQSLESHEHSCNQKDNENNYVKILQENDYLKKELERMKEENKKLLETSKNTTTNNTTNNITNNNYNIKFSVEFDKMPQFIKENVKESLLANIDINSIKGGEQQYINDFVDGIKKFVIVKDIARGKLITKDEEGNECKTTSNKVVQKSLNFIKDEQETLIEQVQQDMPEFDGTNVKENGRINGMVNTIKQVHRDIEKDKINDFVNTIANKLTKEGILIS